MAVEAPLRRLPTQSRPRARRRGPSGRARRLVLGNLTLLALLGVWELVSRLGILPASYFPPASETVARLLALLVEGSTWGAIGETVLTWFLGLTIGICLAVPVGFLLGSNRWFHRFTVVPIELLKPVPPVVFIPPAVLLLGTTQDMKVMLSTYAAFWPILLQAIAGVESADPVARRTLRAFHIRPLDRVWAYLLPAASPFVLSGVRIAASLALISAVVTELVSGAPGLGSSISLAQVSGASTEMYALILIAGLLGLAVNRLFELLERRLLRWSRRGTEE